MQMEWNSSVEMKQNNKVLSLDYTVLCDTVKQFEETKKQKLAIGYQIGETKGLPQKNCSPKKSHSLIE